MKVKGVEIAKEVIRSDGWWRFACGDVLLLYISLTLLKNLWRSARNHRDLLLISDALIKSLTLLKNIWRSSKIWFVFLLWSHKSCHSFSILKKFVRQSPVIVKGKVWRCNSCRIFPQFKRQTASRQLEANGQQMVSLAWFGREEFVVLEDNFRSLWKWKCEDITAYF